MQMIKLKTKLASFLALVIAFPLCLTISEGRVNQWANGPEWNGTWVLQKADGGSTKSQATGHVTLVISQTSRQINITRKLKENGNEIVQELTYYTDGRGEENPTSDGKRTFRSNTKLRDRKLIVKFSLPSSTVNRRSVVNERIDEWRLSSDAKTLTQISSFTITSTDSDASNNRSGSSRTPTILASPLRWKETKVFKRA